MWIIHFNRASVSSVIAVHTGKNAPSLSLRPRSWIYDIVTARLIWPRNRYQILTAQFNVRLLLLGLAWSDSDVMREQNGRA